MAFSCRLPIYGRSEIGGTPGTRTLERLSESGQRQSSEPSAGRPSNRTSALPREWSRFLPESSAEPGDLSPSASRSRPRPRKEHGPIPRLAVPQGQPPSSRSHPAAGRSWSTNVVVGRGRSPVPAGRSSGSEPGQNQGPGTGPVQLGQRRSPGQNQRTEISSGGFLSPAKPVTRTVRSPLPQTRRISPASGGSSAPAVMADEQSPVRRYGCGLGWRSRALPVGKRKGEGLTASDLRRQLPSIASSSLQASLAVENRLPAWEMPARRFPGPFLLPTIPVPLSW